MKRRAEQGSMQRQGEVQELLLEEILRENFPFDLIEEVGKGWKAQIASRWCEITSVKNAAELSMKANAPKPGTITG